VIRAYKFLMRPTVGQAVALTEMLQDHCSLYNGALQERRDAYRHASKTSVKYGMQAAQLKDIRAFDPESQGRWSFSSQQATLRRLDKAFAAFFRRVKSGEAPGYPRFRGSGTSTRWTSPRTGTVADGTARRTTRSPVSACKVSGTSRSTSTEPWSARSRRSRSSVRASAGMWC
jgi:putative transposase